MDSKEIKMVRQTRPGQSRQKFNVIVDGMMAGYVSKNILSDGTWESYWEGFSYKDGRCIKVGQFKSKEVAADEIAYS
jgi:hypothetical protein